MELHVDARRGVAVSTAASRSLAWLILSVVSAQHFLQDSGTSVSPPSVCGVLCVCWCLFRLCPGQGIRLPRVDVTVCLCAFETRFVPLLPLSLGIGGGLAKFVFLSFLTSPLQLVWPITFYVLILFSFCGRRDEPTCRFSTREDIRTALGQRRPLCFFFWFVCCVCLISGALLRSSQLFLSFFHLLFEGFCLHTLYNFVWAKAEGARSWQKEAAARPCNSVPRSHLLRRNYE